MRVLVLGGYGFIGAEITRALLARGDDVVGLGRDAGYGRRILPKARWIGADLGDLTRPEDWRARLEGVAAIVNAAGALQDGGRDDLDVVHRAAISALIEASETVAIVKFVQISAVGAAPDAATAFMRTKGEGDAALRASTLEWTIFKPGLVIGRNAFGGTTLIRMLAATPFLQMLAYPETPVQTVSIDDVVDAVLKALDGAVASRCDFDLVEDRASALANVVGAFRSWLGFPTPRVSIEAPDGLTGVLSTCADFAGAIGWRSPLRSTAMLIMKEGVVGDPAAWRNATGRSLRALDQTLASMPATAQERLYARAMLALPLMVVALALFWIVSGVIALVKIDEAASHLPIAGEGAKLAVVAGAFADVAIGGALTFRRWTKVAALAGAALALFYLAAGTILAPHLWLDPLGAYVKVVPAIVLSLTLALILGER